MTQLQSIRRVIIQDIILYMLAHGDINIRQKQYGKNNLQAEHLFTTITSGFLLHRIYITTESGLRQNRLSIAADGNDEIGKVVMSNEFLWIYNDIPWRLL